MAIWLAGLSTTTVHATESAGPPRVAIVIANAAYPRLPPLPRCAASAQAISGALRQGGFDVAEADNASNGEIGGILEALKARLHPGPRSDVSRASPQGATVLYVCGYARGFDGRSYLLPVDVHIEQPTDLLAQGVLLRSFLSAAAGSGAAAGLVLLDLVPATDDAELLPGLNALTSTSSPSIGIAAALTSARPTSATDEAAVATPLATAAAAVLSAPKPEAGAVIAAIRATIDPGGGRLVIAAPTAVARLDPTIPTPASKPTATTSSAAASPILSPPANVATASPATTLATASPATTEPTAPSTTAAVTTPEAAAPLADVTTLAGRRGIQQDLLRLGYYAGPVDGIFGPDSQAAMRRLQHELGATLTGSLTPDEITQLQARAR